MYRRYLTAAFLAFITSGLDAQIARQAPRLVVNIAIDELTTECIEAYDAYFGSGGFKRLMKEGVVYPNVSYPFEPIDRSSAIASLVTGTSPYYHGIISNQWLNKTTLHQTGCTDDEKTEGIFTTEKASPVRLLTSTIGDELKLATQGKAIVYGIAKQKDAAILSAGHAADGALWKDGYNNQWCTSTYYMRTAPEWLAQFNMTSSVSGSATEFQQLTELTNLAIACIEHTGMGTDNVSDFLSITLDASTPIGKKENEWKARQTQTYIALDRQLSDLIATIQSKVGEPNVVFFITSTGHLTEPSTLSTGYRIPTGKVYMNRLASLLNLYLGAMHGSDRYVEGSAHNQLYLDHKLLEKKRLRLSDILVEAQSFLLQCEGVRKAHTLLSLMSVSQPDAERIRNGMNASVGGDIVVEIAPGWLFGNEDTQEWQQWDVRTVRFPLYILTPLLRPQRIATTITTDRIAPTIANTIHIRAPNACTAPPLY